METQVWTLIALMFTALVGLFFFVATRFDSLNGRLESRFDSLNGRLESRFGRLESRLDSLNGRLESRLDSLNGRLESRLDPITGRLDEQSLLLHELKAQSTLHGEGLERLDGRVDNLEGEVRALGRSLGNQIYSVATKLDEHLRRHAS